MATPFTHCSCTLFFVFFGSEKSIGTTGSDERRQHSGRRLVGGNGGPLAGDGGAARGVPGTGGGRQARGGAGAVWLVMPALLPVWFGSDNTAGRARVCLFPLLVCGEGSGVLLPQRWLGFRLVVACPRRWAPPP